MIGSRAKTRKYSAAIVGLGSIAWRLDRCLQEDLPPRTHCEALSRNQQVDLVGGYSPDGTDRKEFRETKGLPTFDSLNELLELKPDLVSICSPPEYHHEHSMACLAQGVPMIWLEKPPTMTLSEVDRLLEYQRRHSPASRIVVNYMRRYSDQYQHFVDAFRSEVVGAPIAIGVSYSRGLESNASHFLDLVAWIFDDRMPDRIEVESGHRERSSPSFSLYYDSGFPVQFFGCDVSFNIGDVVMTCEHGRLSILSGGLGARVEAEVPNALYAGYTRLKEVRSDILAESGIENWFSAALDDLISSYENQEPSRSSLLTARTTQAVIAEIREI